ncbi:phage tail protein, partial [Glaesserella parasuis]
MAIFYKDGFYNNDHGGFVPEGACEISEETYRLLLEGQAQGKLIV